MSKREITIPNYTRGEEIFNMVSHIVGGAVGVVALSLCVIFAAIHGDPYAVVGSAWGLPFVEQIKTTILALATLLGSCLGVSCANYYSDGGEE